MTTTTTPSTATTPTRRVDVDGTRFAYRELGPRTGAPLLLPHHFTTTIDDSDPRVQHHDRFVPEVLQFLR